MHEVATMQGTVRTALAYMRQAGAARVTNVQLSIAASWHFIEDVVRQYFVMFTAGTPAKDATLTIIWLSATYRCLACLQTFQSLQPAVEALCPAWLRREVLKGIKECSWEQCFASRLPMLSPLMLQCVLGHGPAPCERPY